MKHSNYSLTFTVIFIILAISAKAGYKDSMLALIPDHANKPHELYNIYYDLGNYALSHNYEESISFFENAIQTALKGENKYNLALAYIGKANAYSLNGNIEKSHETTWHALKIALGSNDHELQYYSYIKLAEVFRRTADYDSALYCYLQSARISEEYLNDTLTATAYSAMGGYYATIGQEDKALEYHNKSLELREANKDLNAMANSYDNIGIIYRIRGNYYEALKWYNKARTVYEETGDSSDIAFIYNDIGAAHSKSGTLDSGDYYLKKSIIIRERMKEYIELAYTYNYLGENYERMNRLDSAEYYIKKALALAIDIKNNKQHYQALESLSDFYSRNKMYDSAYVYLKAHKLFRDSIRRLDNQALIAELNTKYETEKKEKKIQEQEFELTKRNYFLGAAFLIVLFGGLLGYSSYRRYKLRKTAEMQQAILKQQELATKAVLEAEENERQRIASDLHDGVGQMMSAAKINLSNISEHISFASNDEKTRFDNAMKLVDDSCAEVRAVSHNIMPNALLRNSLTAAVRAFINKISEQVIKINLYTEGLNERIDENAEVMLYRVAQECINNVIKHAKANTLDISLIRDGNEISVTIEDNGIGFDTTNKKVFDGIGLKSIRSRVDYLKGTVEWDSRTGKGTVVSILIPLEA